MTRDVIWAVAVASLIVSACSGDEGREWGAIREFGPSVVANATELAATDDFRLLLDERSAGSCVQLVVNDVPWDCIEASSGVRSIPLRVDDLRVVWLTVSDDDGIAAVADHFVVWSSVDPDGRRIEPITAGGSAHLVWVMQPGEAPWGVQTVAADGTLYTATSMVGLPAS